MLQSSNTANLLLLLIAALWGLTFPVIKTIIGNIDPSVFVCARFFIAALVLLPFIRFNTFRCKQTLMAGLILGVLNSGVYLLQTSALGHLSAARCAFLTGSVVLWVPLFGHLFTRMQINFSHILAGCLCLFGLLILTGADLQGIGIGDGMMLMAEACFALSLLYLEKISLKCSSILLLTFYQIVFTFVVPFILSIASHASFAPLLESRTLMAVGFCAVFATALSLWLQVYCQRRTSSVHTALIFSMEPLWAAIFAFSLFGEMLTPQLIIGGLIMVMSIALPEMWLLWSQRLKV